MGLAEITRSAVLAAIAEYDELGSEAFLRKYGFSRAQAYFLQHEGNQYDSKAIVGAAHGYLPGGTALRPDDFSGGEQTVALCLKRLGFETRARADPSWTRDEVILACELVSQNDWRWLSARDPRVHDLSDVLQRLPVHPPEVRGPKFRNPNGVARKTADIATHHPSYQGKPTKGGAVDKQVLQDFLERPDEMHGVARALRAGLASGGFVGLSAQDGNLDDESAVEAPEGRLLARQHFARERNPKLRARKIKAAMAQHGCLKCETCGFDFKATYGPRGDGYIECHHAVPLHASGETTTRLDDLVLLCSNCHRMIHRGTPWLTPDELRHIIGSGLADDGPPRAADLFGANDVTRR